MTERRNPVLNVGGSGVVGSQAAHLIRRLHPEVPITIGARDTGRAVAVERLLGLADGPPPGPGLYLPEMIVDRGHLVRRLEAFGVSITVRTSLAPHEQAHAAT